MAFLASNKVLSSIYAARATSPVTIIASSHSVRSKAPITAIEVRNWKPKTMLKRLVIAVLNIGCPASITVRIVSDAGTMLGISEVDRNITASRDGMVMIAAMSCFWSSRRRMVVEGLVLNLPPSILLSLYPA